MSESVEIKKTIELSIQIDYIKCTSCGEEMVFSVESDSYGDVQIYADKCNCVD